MVDNLLAGNGPVFNAGERVEVATSPLWLAILTCAEAVIPGTGVMWASVVLGLVSTVAGVLLAAAGARRLLGRPLAPVVPFGVVVFATLPPTWDFATSGLETGLSFGWTGACSWGLSRWVRSGRSTNPRVLWLFVLVGIGPLIRPDLAIPTVLFLGWMTAVAAGGWGRRVRGLLVAAVLPVGYQVFRMGYYGLLVPNTAVAKESSRALWARGTDYLTDLTGPYSLWVPALTALALVLVVTPRAGWRLSEWSLSAVLLAAGVLHALYVIRVGGDFMHARLLMPSLFLVLCPIAVVPVPSDRRFLVGALLAVTAAWAIAATTLRVGYEGSIGPAGIADERGFYAQQAGTANPVTLGDREGSGVLAYATKVRALDHERADLVVVQVSPVTEQTPVLVLAPSSGGVVFSVFNAGFYGVAAGLDVWVVDQVGLTDPVAAHLEAPPPARPGHEKVFPPAWLLGRYGAPELATGASTHPAGAPPEQVAGVRGALGCGALADLVAATGDPLDWTRFWDNVRGAVGRTSLRIPEDPLVAEARFCSPIR
ncbi:arabinofuranosyltransferase [Geodermatophilus sp. TF02-6]|uniref:arabinofuranosyltransferase n=1 Tax=Geodermatophilus sp. TF02-6 TaxID=2250575 RepID=UPI000DE8B79E|nr:arabinofuranosyltransferase [Geodermatophilus sp. TF02-6]RBY77814.1 arabinofuranosyltransferase [Geodermatophilus sp. TF02-6]